MRDEFKGSKTDYGKYKTAFLLFIIAQFLFTFSGIIFTTGYPFKEEVN